MRITFGLAGNPGLKRGDLVRVRDTLAESAMFFVLDSCMAWAELGAPPLTLTQRIAAALRRMVDQIRSWNPCNSY